MAASGIHLSIKAEGLARLQKACADDRTLRKPLRKLMRTAGNVIKAEYKARATSRRLARKTRLKIRQGRAPAYIPESVHVVSKYGGAPAIVSGRRPGAKMPPIAAVRGGFPAARAIGQRGIPGKPFVEAVFQTVRQRVDGLLREGSREIEHSWKMTN